MIKDKLFAALVGLGLLALAIIMGIGIRGLYRNYRKCIDNGGHFEDRNCRTETTVKCHYDLNGQLVGCWPETHSHCDHVCVGASAEAR